MNRPRSKDRKQWPDYLLSRKTKKGDYYLWKHPKTGQEFALGYSLEFAKSEARIANLKLLSAVTAKPSLAERIEGIVGNSMSDWLLKFKEILDKRPSKKKGVSSRAESTRREDDRRIAVLDSHFRGSLIEKITTKDCADLIAKYQDAGQDRTAYLFRAFMVDCFSEAESAGWIPRGSNPAEITKARSPVTKRNRLSFDQFSSILDQSDGWFKTALLLGLITGQRVGDIANMKYADIEGEHWLKVIQEKTGARIKIPLSLDINNISLGSVIKQSRNVVGAKNIVHQTERTIKSKPGDPISKATIGNTFAAKVDSILGKKWEGTRPTFHELRSLSKFMHTARGVDTLILLGHESAKTGQIYADPRGGWVEVKSA